MVQVRCPQCASLVEGIEGQEAICGHCGFKALLPVTKAAGLNPPSAPTPLTQPSAAPTAAATMAQPATVPATGGAMLAIWGYILGIAAIATFFLAAVGLPFAFGAAAVVLSVIARQKEKTDRRAFIGLILGAIGLAAAVVWLLL
jgi:hypothetical protein